jgi:hypothetical protein
MRFDIAEITYDSTTRDVRFAIDDPAVQARVREQNERDPENWNGREFRVGVDRPLEVRSWE